MVAPPSAKPGRRPGRRDTRSEILDAARALFAVHGFTGTSMRAIAARAEVDAALIHHYFDTKQSLFLHTMKIPIPVDQLIAELTAAGVEGLGKRLITGLLGAWESEAQPALIVALRSGVADPAMTRSLREFLTGDVIATITATLDVDQAESERRAALVASQVIGVLVGRYLVKLPALTELPRQTLIDSVGDTLQRYLDGDVPGLGEWAC